MMKRFFTRIFIALLLFIGVFCIWKFELVVYGIGQLKGQLSIIRNARPIAEVLQDSALSVEYREKLLLAGEIRRFAMDSLGLANSDNYTTFYNQKDKPVLWVVTGCKPFFLEAKEWWFPLIGNVTYKGFFDEWKANVEAAKVRGEGYETDIYNPSAWSTLGYFTDPILSNQLKRGPGRLAELIIHELTHATVYLKSNVDFNENLATFIGERGATEFLESKYGVDSEQAVRYKNFLADDELYNNAMMFGAQRLDSLYRNMDPEKPVTEKALIKFRMIARILLDINRLPFAQPERYKYRFEDNRLPDNTSFMSFLRYRKRQGNFEEELRNKFNGNLKAFIAYYITVSH